MANEGCPSRIHGTGHAYRRLNCRCPETMAALAAEQAAYRERKKAGIQGFIDATETHRMLRALMAAGHTCTDLSERLGYSGREGTRQLFRSRRVHRDTYSRIKSLYDAMQNVPGASVRGKRRAASKGWAVPFAWDPETITDPEAQPDHGAPRRGWLPAKELLYEYQAIRDSGMTHAYALRELGVKHDAWEAAMKKLGLNGPKADKQAPEPTRRASNGSLHGMDIT